MTADRSPAVRSAVRGARRGAIIAIVTSLSGTALIGIATLLLGTFGDLQLKIMLTTLALAAGSITALCHLAVVGRTLQLVGFAGLAASALAFVFSLLLIWWFADFSPSAQNTLLKTLGTLVVIALSLAHANLLLLLGGRRRSLIRWGLRATLLFIAIVGVMIILPILSDGKIPGSQADLYWRLIGTALILDVLGTIVLPVTGAFVRDAPRFVAVRLSPELASRVDAAAAATGRTRDQLVAAAVERSLS